MIEVPNDDTSTYPPGGGEPCADFAEFYIATVQRTLNAVRSLAGNDHEAWDAVQEAYVRMLDRWAQKCVLPLRENQNYTIAIARNLVFDGFRRRRRCAELDEELQMGEDDPGLVAVLDEMSLMRAVRGLLDSWPPRLRAVAVLRVVEGLDYAEIATLLMMAESTVRSHMAKARDRLKPCVGRLEELDANEGGGRS